MKLTIKVCVCILFEKCPRPKINQFKLSSFEINNKVLILDVSVNDTLAVTG